MVARQLPQLQTHQDSTEGNEVQLGSGEKVQGPLFYQGRTSFSETAADFSWLLIIQNQSHGHSYMQKKLEKFLAILGSILHVQ